MKYDNFKGQMVPDLEDEPTIIGDYVFERHKGDLSVVSLKNLVNVFTYHPVDYFDDLIDALNHFKDEGLQIKLESKDFAKLVEGACWESPMGWKEGDGIFINRYVPFNRYDFIKDYGAFRRLVLIRDDYKCLCCGNDNEKDLQVHHIRSFKDNLELATSVKNGATLCKDCHKKYHKKYGWNGKQKTFSKFIKEMMD